MIGKRIGIASALVGIVSTMLPALSLSQETDEVNMANAGVVVSVTEDFLQRGQNELIREFVKKMNVVSQ